MTKITKKIIAFMLMPFFIHVFSHMTTGETTLRAVMTVYRYHRRCCSCSSNHSCSSKCFKKEESIITVPYKIHGCKNPKFLQPCLLFVLIVHWQICVQNQPVT